MKAIELEKRIGKAKRKTVSELKHVIAKRADKNPNFCLFLGSGASRSSGIRTAGEMVKEWRELAFQGFAPETATSSASEMIAWLTENAAEWYDPKHEYASLIERIYPTPRNRRQFIETEVANKIPSIGYAYLVRLAEFDLIRTIFTTNFDDLLNEAFYQLSKERALVCAHDSAVSSISITSHRTKIIKLHGDYLFDNLKNTASEVRDLEKNMREKLQEFLKEYGLIIAGYSGGDRSIMRILESLIDDQSYLQNGLYWCFRSQDTISDPVCDILKRGNGFYVLIDGFDELMAEIYSLLQTDATPFNSKLASDRAAKIINSYITSEHLRATPSKTIKKHLDTLASDKNASLLSDAMKDLSAERIASSGLSDENLLVYMEIDRALRDRNPELALNRLTEELAKTKDRNFKEILLHRRYLCSMRLNRFHEARNAVKEVLALEPRNLYVALGECSLIERRSDRIAYLEQLKVKHPFSAEVFNEYASEVLSGLEKRDKIGNGLRIEDVTSALKRSLEVDPSVANPAWMDLFNVYAKQGSGGGVRESLEVLVDDHLRKDAFSYRTSALLLRFCRKFKSTEYKGTLLLDYLRRAYENHFPRNPAAHLDVLIDACIEFDGHRILRPLLEAARKEEELIDDPHFATLMMNVYYDVFRDLSKAIDFGQHFLKGKRKPSVEIRLLELHLENGSPRDAREIHSNLRGAIDLTRFQVLESKICEYEQRYQDAIDAIEIIQDRREFEERYTSVLSYLELKMNAPARARKRCKAFLEERHFPFRCEAEIINYEFSKVMDHGNVDKKRVGGLKQATESELVKGVCHSLLREDKEALEIFKKEAEKRFSHIDQCLHWPVLSRHRHDLKSLREQLLKERRSLTEQLYESTEASLPIAV